MKYSKLLDTKVITERQGAQVPRLVQYANDEEINSKRDFLDWDILMLPQLGYQPIQQRKLITIRLKISIL